ncbi:MAG: helix-turn-helix domain-containing protein [Dehalococcoidia bacterium]
MTQAEVAEALRCSVVTVKRLVASGELPSIKAGKLRRVRRSDLAVWSGTKPAAEVA